LSREKNPASQQRCKAGQATDSTHRKIKCASLSQIAADWTTQIRPA